MTKSGRGSGDQLMANSWHGSLGSILKLVLAALLAGSMASCGGSSSDPEGPSFRLDEFTLFDCTQQNHPCRVEMSVTNVGADSGAGECAVSSPQDSDGIAASIPETASGDAVVIRTKERIEATEDDIRISCSPGAHQ